VTKQTFTEFHRLIAEATQLIENITAGQDDPHVKIKRLNVVYSLIESQKHALELETLFDGIAPQKTQ
jgi:hypothetical protein